MPTTKGSLIEVLDEQVVLLSMLETPGETGPHEVIDGSLYEENAQWQNFLDQLCWLCDRKCGGKTVTAIAVQQSTHCKFWIAGNEGCTQLSEQHLKWLLCKLATRPHNTQQKANLFDQMFTECVMFSSKRVSNYAERLRCFVSEVQKLNEYIQTDETLRQYLDRLTSCKNDKTLCAKAFAFRGSPASQRLKDLIARSDQSGVWAGMRHYIGRLGSWWKAVSLSIAMAEAMPAIFTGATVQRIPHQPIQTGCLINTPGHAASGQMRMKLQSVRARLRARHGDKIDKDIEEKLNHKHAKPCSHAELSVHEYFHLKNLRFFGDIRYIGCSKPSCYCCDLYINLHPMRVIPRQSHGNVWPRWTFPLHQSHRSPERLRATNELIRKMTERMSARLENALELRAKGEPESTTNMSSIVPPIISHSLFI